VLLDWEIEQLADELTELFGRRVDLVSLRSPHPMLKPSVLAEARQHHRKRLSAVSGLLTPAGVRPDDVNSPTGL